MAAPQVNSTAPDRIGDLLVKEGLITREQLAKAISEQKQTGARLGYCLVKLALVPEVELTKVKHFVFNAERIDKSTLWHPAL